MKRKTSKYHPNVANKLKTVIESQPDSLWQNLDYLITTTKLPVRNIYRVIAESDVFVTAKNNYNEPVITTRRRYIREQSLYKRLIGAFTNQIEY